MRRAIPLLLILASACVTAALLEHATVESPGPGPVKRGVKTSGDRRGPRGDRQPAGRRPSRPL